MVDQSENGAGEAYAFFNCPASRLEIERELPHLRDSAKTPGELEISLGEGIDLSNYNDGELRFRAQRAKHDGLGYSARASCEGLTDKQVASELKDVLIQAWLSPLYRAGERDGEGFKGRVVYEEGGRYIDME